LAWPTMKKSGTRPRVVPARSACSGEALTTPAAAAAQPRRS
jgi:hypothetical protein